MNTATTNTLTAVFSDVLANLAFMFTDGEELDPCPASTWLETTVSYRGPSAGTLRLRCASEFSVLLAANLLGIDPEDPDAELKAQDGVKEFMNIVCGQWVTAVYGHESVFDLSIPATRVLDEMPDWQSVDDQEGITLSVEGQLVQLTCLPGMDTDLG